MYRRIIFIVILLSLVSCSPKLTSTYVESTNNDTTKVVKEVILHDTIFFAKIPNESKEVCSTDTSSVLETSVAKSEAKWQNGYLFHSLENKTDVLLPINVTIPETQVTTEHSQLIIKTETVTVIQKERYVSWWQKVFIWIGVAAVVFVVIRAVIWIYRGGVTSLLKKFI